MRKVNIKFLHKNRTVINYFRGCLKSPKMELNYKFSSALLFINQRIALGGICNSAVKLNFLNNLMGVSLNFAFFLFLIILISCNSSPRDLEDNSKQSGKDEKLVKINKYLVEKDVDIIKGYVKRQNWDMQVTETGLWYMIYEKGNGEPAQKGKNASLEYKLSLLDGTLCYSSEKDGVKKFIIGQGGVETGLEEGILLMHVGDKARFILPPYMAHGLLGDEKCIPPRSIILYEVELTKLSE